MLMQAIWMHCEIDDPPIQLVDGKYTWPTFSIICDFEFVMNILQKEHISDGSFIEPNFAIVLHESLFVHGE